MQESCNDRLQQIFEIDTVLLEGVKLPKFVQVPRKILRQRPTRLKKTLGQSI